MVKKSTQTKRYIDSDLREVKGKGKFKGRYESEKGAIDNLEYGTKKYAVQEFNNSANMALDSVTRGLDLTQSTLDLLEFDYKNLIKMKAPTESAKKKIEKIKKIYKANEQMKKEGKDPFVERQPFDV